MSELFDCSINNISNDNYNVINDNYINYVLTRPVLEFDNLLQFS